jgi:hypothetical protein
MSGPIIIDGAADVAKALRDYGKRAEDEIAKAVTATAMVINTDVKKRIQKGPKSGVTYYRVPGDKYMTIRAGAIDGPIVAVFKSSGKGNLSLTHTSSKPGEAPASDTGTLASSISFKQVSKLTAEVESRLDYATWLEFGTAGGKIKPRPAWVPATEAARPDFAKRVAAAMERART